MGREPEYREEMGDPTGVDVMLAASTSSVHRLCPLSFRYCCICGESLGIDSVGSVPLMLTLLRVLGMLRTATAWVLEPPRLLIPLASSSEQQRRRRKPEEYGHQV